jgi:hypothetical protein
VAVGAGEEVTLWVARTIGADGTVTAKVETVQGTALAGVNYESATESLVWAPGDVSDSEFHGRPCVTFGDSVDVLAPSAGVELTDGVIEIDMAVTGERAFHGVVWRVRDREHYESFYVRPHQVGNPIRWSTRCSTSPRGGWPQDGFWAVVNDRRVVHGPPRLRRLTRRGVRQRYVFARAGGFGTEDAGRRRGGI